MTSSLQGRPILVVDDDTVFREHLSLALNSRGLLVVQAASYEEAMQRAADHKLDLALVDLKLGSDSGLELVRDLKRAVPDVKILVLTGFGSIATAVRAVRLGALDYLTKPADADDIVQAFCHQGSVLDARPGLERDASLARAEWEHIQRVLSECGGNVTRAAEKLGLHRRSLQRKLARPPEG